MKLKKFIMILDLKKKRNAKKLCKISLINLNKKYH